MKGQNLFSAKSKKIISKCSLLRFLPCMLSDRQVDLGLQSLHMPSYLSSQFKLRRATIHRKQELLVIYCSWTLSASPHWVQPQFLNSSIFEFGHTHCCKQECQSDIKVENRVDPDQMAHDEPTHLDLHCLQWYLFFFFCGAERVMETFDSAPHLP